MTDVAESLRQGEDRQIGVEVIQFLPDFHRMSRQLRETSRQIESSVVGVCSSFHAMAERAQSAVKRTAGFLRSDGTVSDGTLSFEQLIEQCSKALVKILKSAEETGEVSRRAIERVQKIDAVSREINAAIAKLEWIAQENKMLAMNARIEAAHAGAAGAGFAVVAVEVVSQTERANAVTTAVNALVSDLRYLADSTVKDLGRMTLDESERLEQCRAEVSRTLADMRNTHSGMKAVLVGMTDESALLVSDIGAAVRQLQFQDRTGQQIAHVIEDLERAHARLSTVLGGSRSHDLVSSGPSNLTMHEERMIAGSAEVESAAGDVELF